MAPKKDTQNEREIATQVKSLFKQDANVWYKSSNKEISEKFAEYVLDEKNDGIYWLFSIGKITRCKTKSDSRNNSDKRVYAVNHEDTQTGDKDNNEKHICKRIFKAAKQDENQYKSTIGQIIDYETPIRNTSKDKGYKGIDMLSYHKESDTLFFLEAKRQDSDEPLLRAVLEVFTYWKVVDHEKLLYDFKNKMPELSIDPFETKVKKAVLLFEDSPIYNEYVNNESPNTIKLMKKLGVGFYGIRETGDGYEVFVP